MRRILTFVLILSVFGCSYVKEEDFLLLQRQLSQIKKDINSLTSETENLKTTTDKLQESHDKLRQSYAESNSQIDVIDQDVSKIKGDKEILETSVDKSIRELKEAQKAQNDQMTSLTADLAKAKEESAALSRQLAAFSSITSDIGRLKRAPAGNTPRKSREELYEEALSLYKNQEYSRSTEAFENFLILFPQDSLSPNALYWIGESYYSQKKYKDAISYFHRILTDFPNALKVSAALYKEALCLEELGLANESQGALSELVARFPYSDEAKLAAGKLKAAQPQKKKK